MLQNAYCPNCRKSFNSDKINYMEDGEKRRIKCSYCNKLLEITAQITIEYLSKIVEEKQPPIKKNKIKDCEGQTLLWKDLF